MEGSRANNEMININRKYNSYNLNGSGNCVSVSEKVGSFFINGGQNKVFLSSKIDTMIINGNGNKINVSQIIFYQNLIFSVKIKVAESTASSLTGIII
jgi:hypothetical protein